MELLLEEIPKEFKFDDVHIYTVQWIRANPEEDRKYSCSIHDSLVNEASEKAGLKLNIKKLWSWHLVPSLHGK